MDTPNGLSRRHALGGIAAGLTLPVLAACGDGSGEGGTANTSQTPDSPSADNSSAPPATDATSPTAAAGLIAAADVPVGSGVILDDEDLVITQPTKGDFKAFSSTCTHMGCKVSSIDTTIHCGCHGSSFSIADGSVQGGPAPSPLAEESVAVAAGQISLS